MREHTFQLTVRYVMDDEHLNAIVDAINDLAYVPDIEKKEVPETVWQDWMMDVQHGNTYRGLVDYYREEYGA